MGYALQTEAMPQGLAEAFEGQVAELREVSAVEVEAAMAAGAAVLGERRFWALLGASLHVDDKPVGLDAVRAVPGRFTPELLAALNATMRMHGFVRPTSDDEDEGDATEGDEAAPKH